MPPGSSGEDACLSSRVEEGSIPFGGATVLGVWGNGYPAGLSSRDVAGSNPVTPAATNARSDYMKNCCP